MVLGEKINQLSIFYADVLVDPETMPLCCVANNTPSLRPGPGPTWSILHPHALDAIPRRTQRTWGLEISGVANQEQNYCELQSSGSISLLLHLLPLSPTGYCTVRTVHHAKKTGLSPCRGDLVQTPISS